MLKNIIKKILVYIRVIIGRMNGAQITLGDGTYIASGVFFSTGREITIGGDTYIGRHVSLSCHIDIGMHVLIASNVAFVGGDHKIDFVDGNMKDSGRDVIRKITVEDNVWIGHGAVILHGVTLSQGCVVAAGSVVTKSVGQNEVVGGNPARFVRKRKFKT